MKEYFSYIRVSTPRQGERGVSLQEQREAIIRYATKSSLTLSEWFEEQQTAAKRGRPIWNRMLKLLRRGKASGVVIHKIDRSARNLKDWADLGELIDQGIEVHFANESLDLHSRGGRLSADIQAVVASDYIRNLREEAKKGIYGRLKQGYYPMRAPIGYVDQGAGKSKTIDKTKGPLVRRAFELYATGRYTIHTLRDDLYRRGLRNLAGKAISRNGLAKILSNPFYIGIIRIRKNGETFMGNHEALVSKRLFQTVKDVRDGRLNTRKKKHEFLFRRVMKCKLCGYSLIGETKKGHVYYRCHTKECPTMGVREEAVTLFVQESTAKLQFTAPEKDCLRAAIERLKAQWIEEKQRQVAALALRREQADDRLRRLTDAYLDQAIERNLFEERKESLFMERRSIEDSLRHFTDDPGAVPHTLDKFIELAGSACSLYQTATPANQRQILKTVSSNLTLDQKTLGFAYAPPFCCVAKRNRAYGGRPSKGLARTCDELVASIVRQIEACSVIVESIETEPGESSRRQD